MDYRWLPGVGPDEATLKRLASKAPEPHSPMGEAWFMSAEREMYTYLRAHELETIDSERLARPLSELASGTFNFGPSKEWQSWFDYLFPRLISIALKRNSKELQDLLVTAVMSQHPDESHRHGDKNWREDVLNTLGNMMMDPSKWRDQTPILGQVLHDAPSPTQQAGYWYRASSDLSSSLFLCLKYLTPAEIGTWAQSVFGIKDPHWRAQILVWLVGSRTLLEGIRQFPCDLGNEEPRIDWAGSYCIKGTRGVVDNLGPFIAHENLEAWTQSVRELLRNDLDNWRQSIGEIDYLAMEALPMVVELATIYAEPRTREIVR